MMRKFSSLNESYKIENDEIKSIMGDFSDMGFKYHIYDGYYHYDSQNRNLQFFFNDSLLKEESRLSKIIHIYSGDEVETTNIEIRNLEPHDKTYLYQGRSPWRESFFTNNSQTKDVLIEVANLLSHFNDNNPKITFFGSGFVVLIDCGLVESEVSKRGSKLKEWQNKIHEDLRLLVRELGIKDIDIYNYETHIQVESRKAVSRLDAVVGCLINKSSKSSPLTKEQANRIRAIGDGARKDGLIFKSKCERWGRYEIYLAWK